MSLWPWVSAVLGAALPSSKWPDRGSQKSSVWNWILTDTLFIHRNLQNLYDVVATQARSVLSGRADPRFPASNEKRPRKGSKRVGYDVRFTIPCHPGLGLAQSWAALPSSKRPERGRKKMKQNIGHHFIHRNLQNLCDAVDPLWVNCLIQRCFTLITSIHISVAGSSNNWHWPWPWH